MIMNDAMNTTADISGRGISKRWLMLGISFLCLFDIAVVMQSVPPVLSLVMAEFQLSYTQGGLLMSLFALPGILVAIPAGMLADRYSQKVIGIVFFALMIAGVAIFATGNSFPVLGLGRVVSGVGARCIGVVAVLLLAQWFAGREMGIAMGVLNAGIPAGTIMSLILMPWLAESLGWQSSIWFGAVVSLMVFGIFVMLVVQSPRSRQHISPQFGGLLRDIKPAGVSIWLIGIAWMFFNASIQSVFTFTPDLLKAAGYSIASAGFITSMVMWPSLILSPAVGYVIDKIDHKRTIIAVGGVSLAIFIVLIPMASSWILALMLLMGVAQSFIPAPIFALPPEVTTAERLGFGFGILAMWGNFGQMAGPALTGFIIDVTGSYQASYALMAGWALVVAFIMMVLSSRQSQRPGIN